MGGSPCTSPLVTSALRSCLSQRQKGAACRGQCRTPGTPRGRAAQDSPAQWSPRKGHPFLAALELRIRVEPAPGHSVQLQPALALGTAPEIHSLSCHLTSNSAPGSRGYGQTSVGPCQRRPRGLCELAATLPGGAGGVGWGGISRMRAGSMSKGKKII